ncbi:hypothetical protein [Ornithinibacillus xuwenensis]|uniref:Uncharacterized protein n=1 Tax=Ornithinibacillus xuwenensis TaxID=3144668 RepID=A0ABU9XG05_9BACI
MSIIHAHFNQKQNMQGGLVLYKASFFNAHFILVKHCFGGVSNGTVNW